MLQIKKIGWTTTMLLLLGGCVTAPPAEDPVLVKLEEMDDRLSAVERMLASGTLVELATRSDELERESAGLQGRVETLEYQTQSTVGRQRDLYVDLDERIQNLEARLRGFSSATALDDVVLLPGELPVPGGTDRENYQAAFELLKEQQYEAAAMAFQQFLVSFPDSQLADNAQYWLAEAYYVTDSFEAALSQFAVVINEYPRSRKVPDALLKTGYCNYELKRWDDARAALTRVQEEFSDTTAARLAEQRIKRMQDEGN